MKMLKRFISVTLCVALIACVFCGCSVKINVSLKSKDGGATPVAATTPSTTAATTASTTAPSSAETQPLATTSQPAASESNANSSSEPSSDASEPAPSGGELSSSSSKEEIVAEYAKVYNTTKATGTFVGHDSMECASVILDGKENGMLKGIAGPLMKTNGTNMQLPPYSDDNPAKECLITAADISEATYTDNGDGTATIKLTPIEVTNSKKFNDAQGKMFNVMEDVAAALANISVISWSQGDANSNVNLTTKEGYAEVTYNKDTKMMTAANYVLVTYADVQHCNVSFFKDKSATAKFIYTTTFPG